MNKLKVLDLFGGSNSVKKALQDVNYISIDITGDNIILDMSSDDIIEELLNKLPVNWIPDVIWASPPCNKFSLATAVRGGNLYFQKTDSGVKVREDIKPVLRSIYKNKSIEDIQYEADKAIKLVKNTIKIIKYFDVPYVIENPTRAYTHFFIDIGYRSKTEYCMYGYDYKKPTSLWSNVKLELNRCNHKTHTSKIGSRTTVKMYGEKQKKISDYSNKASVPTDLIKTIIRQLLRSVKDE